MTQSNFAVKATAYADAVASGFDCCSQATAHCRSSSTQAPSPMQGLCSESSAQRQNTHCQPGAQQQHYKMQSFLDTGTDQENGKGLPRRESELNLGIVLDNHGLSVNLHEQSDSCTRPCPCIARTCSACQCTLMSRVHPYSHGCSRDELTNQRLCCRRTGAYVQLDINNGANGLNSTSQAKHPGLPVARAPLRHHISILSSHH